MSYDFKRIEKKWQKFWEDHKTFSVSEDENYPKEKRRYVLDMFPYPSGAGLHVGHPEGYTATDIYCRYLRMHGFNVLHPMGYDAFGLPAENYAIKTGTHPRETTMKNIENFTRQIKSLGFSYDWGRCVITSEADYYRWTQWIFLRLYKKGLAYETDSPINFCPSCKTGLANEEVKDGKCERCGSTVTRKSIRQWVLKITAYADRLLSDLDSLDWPESVKAMQRNWIGRSEGAEVDFAIASADGSASEKKLRVYTTRCDTLFGATYMVVAPEHALIPELVTAAQKAACENYIKNAAKKSDLERTDLAKEKTGVFTGSYAINPMTGKRIPVWISDYVLATYGTGAIMAVPAHDDRDWDFAKKFHLPIVKVVASKEEIAELAAGDFEKAKTLLSDSAEKSNAECALEKKFPHVFLPGTACTSADGIAIHSRHFSGMESEQAKREVVKFLEAKKIGKRAVNYKLRDWVFSRQRYWGEPIPLVHCQKCGIVPLPEKDLPLLLPEIKSYEPTGTGESPLAGIADWVNCTCPKCGGKAKRETNTMPQWAGSCWYYLRYLDAKNKNEFCAKEKERYWMPVDLYVGGAEHAVLHLLYARFWHKVLFDLGLVSTKEPFQKLINQGMVTSFAYERKNKTLVPVDQVEEKDGAFFEKKTGECLTQVIAKMSKSLKNVVNPDEEIQKYGADSVRMYEMFMGPLTLSKPWNAQGIIGVHRFLEKVWALSEKEIADIDIRGALNEKNSKVRKIYAQSVKKITSDTESFSFNTAISQMMILINELSKLEKLPREIWEGFIKMLSCYAPHIGEELWEKCGYEKTIAFEAWPVFDEKFAADATKTIAVMINGKLRATFDAKAGSEKAVLEKTALVIPNVQKYTNGKTVAKIIVVPDKVVNIVVK